MRSESPIKKLREAPVAALGGVVLACGLLVSLAWGAAFVGADALRGDLPSVGDAGRALWAFRERFNTGFGRVTGLSRIWFWINWDLCGQAPTNRVAIGANGWLFLRDEGELDDAMGRRPWTEAEWREWVHRLESWCEVARQRGVPLLIAVAPNKTAIIPALHSELPGGRLASTRYDELLARRGEFSPCLQESLVDLHGPLRADPSLGNYFLTDTHWSFRGASIASEVIVDHLRRLGVTAAQRSSQRMKPHEVDGGDLARMMGASTRFREVALLPSRHEGIGSLESLQDAPPPGPIDVAEDSTRVLVIHDSFGMILRDPLSNQLPGCRFEKTSPASMSVEKLASLLEEAPYDAIIIQFVERRLMNE